MDQEKRERQQEQDRNSREAHEKQVMEKTVSQRINWVEPEERYVNQGEFIGPNTYRTGKLDPEAAAWQEKGTGTVPPKIS